MLTERKQRKPKQPSAENTLWETESLSPLGSLGEFTSKSKAMYGYSSFGVHVFTDQNGTITVEGSHDGTSSWRTLFSEDVTANVSYDKVFVPMLTFLRVKYVNGASTQSIFELVILRSMY